jgi:prepilin-type N-terminal cleavage/methylation domain-containing protein
MKLETSNRKLDAGVQGAGKGSVANGQRPTANGTGARQRAGFTLVEMLVVVVIILILLGVVFKMLRPAGNQAAKAATIARLERLKAALEEFYAEYGQYPPVPYYKNVSEGSGPDSNLRLRNIVPEGKLAQPVVFEYPTTNGMSSDLTGSFKDQTWERAPLFIFGLMSFLVNRNNHTGRFNPNKPDYHKEKWYNDLFEDPQWGQNNSDRFNQTRHANAVARWWPFVADAIYPKYPDEAGRPDTMRFIDQNQTHYNSFVSAKDAWPSGDAEPWSFDRDFIYISPPPHQSYLLFSRGPDGKYDFDNPEDRKRPDNKDNIYGDAGH